MLRYEIEEMGYAEVVSRYEHRFATYLEPSNNKNAPEGVPAMALEYFPVNFTNRWPILAVSELDPEYGTHQKKGIRGSRLSLIRIGVRIYHLSFKMIGDLEEYRFDDGREKAKRAARAVFSAWLQKFEADDVAGLEPRLRISAGDTNDVGEWNQQPNNPSNILWVHSTTVEIPT